MESPVHPECQVCGDGVDPEIFECHICKEKICEDCHDRGSSQINEWLEISLKCTKCGKLTCPHCMSLCYSCANEGNYVEHCNQCSTKQIKSICNLHDWYLCDRHDSEERFNGCGECRANYNYSRRMQG